MGFSFRKSIKIFPGFRVNIGKRGVSASIGVRGATLNIGRRGVKTTVGMPGTGISYSSSAKKTAKADIVPTQHQANDEKDNEPIRVPILHILLALFASWLVIHYLFG